MDSIRNLVKVLKDIIMKNMRQTASGQRSWQASHQSCSSQVYYRVQAKMGQAGRCVWSHDSVTNVEFE